MVETVEGIQQGDVLNVDLKNLTVFNTRTGVSLLITNLTGISLEILQAGGIIAYTKQRKGISHD
jgi:3-isopropylmalate dehydratase small subunit